MTRVLVTGGTGFLGLEVVRQLVARGDTVRVLSRTPTPLLAELGVELWLGDVVRGGDVPHTSDGPPVGQTRRAAALQPSLDSALADCDAILHLAGFVSRDPDDGQRMMRLHVDGTRRVLEAAARAGIRRVVVASTSGTIAVSRAPDALDEHAPYPLELVGAWPYYLSKIYEEKLALSLGKSLGLDVVIVNPSLLLGPGDARQSSTGDVRRFLAGEIPIMPRGGLSFIDVRDAAQAVIAALQARPNSRYLLGGPNWTFADFFARVGRVARQRPFTFALPARLQTSAAAAWDTLVRATGRRPTLDRVSVEMAQLYWYCDSSRATRELGLTIRDPQETIADTIRDLRARSL